MIPPAPWPAAFADLGAGVLKIAEFAKQLIRGHRIGTATAGEAIDVARCNTAIPERDDDCCAPWKFGLFRHVRMRRGACHAR